MSKRTHSNMMSKEKSKYKANVERNLDSFGMVDEQLNEEPTDLNNEKQRGKLTIKLKSYGMLIIFVS